jgi:CelD/BcsL family acetyltransferase involved in cellulose biosynthesis
MASSAGRAYEVTLIPAPPLPALQAEWESLSRQLSAPIFLDWLWVGTWLESFAPRALLARVTSAGDPVALGLFVPHTEHRHGVLRSTVASLHQTGIASQDQIWVEYNNLLAVPEHETDALTAVVEHLLTDGGCEEVHLSMVPETTARAVCQAFPHARIEYPVRGYEHDLTRARRDARQVIDTLSKNTRHQLRRSIRRYEETHGPAALLPATSIDGALALFEEAGAWHRQRWPDSGFNNPRFVDFHQNLIKRGFDHGNAQLFRVSFGDHTLGVFYFLVSSRHVYFYLQGVRSEADGKLKPGMSGHLLLMQHFLEQGMDVYDFMGGDSQYKRQLSNGECGFLTLRVDNGGLKFRVEQSARQLKQRLLGD